MHIKLDLTTTSLHNVVISNDSDDLYYEVVTPGWEPHLTTIKKIDPYTKDFHVIAEFQNEKEKPISVRLAGQLLRPVDQFLNSTTTVGGPIWRFQGKDGHQYRWKVKDSHLELVRDRNLDNPLVVHYHHKRYLHILLMSQFPYLEVDPIVVDTLDIIIITFLLAERQRRDGPDKAP